jgi:hypothetical protein
MNDEIEINGIEFVKQNLNVMCYKILRFYYKEKTKCVYLLKQ